MTELLTWSPELRYGHPTRYTQERLASLIRQKLVVRVSRGKYTLTPLGVAVLADQIPI